MNPAPVEVAKSLKNAVVSKVLIKPGEDNPRAEPTENTLAVAV
jgi:hypothetical protein